MTACIRIGPLELLRPPGKDTAASKDRWNLVELGYFDPQPNKFYLKGDIISVNKET